MIKQTIKVFLFAFLLLSATIIPSSSLAYAAGDLVVDSQLTLSPGENNYDSIDVLLGGELIIPNGVTVTVTPIPNSGLEDSLQVFEGGKITIEEGGKLIVAGIPSPTLNNGEIIVDGYFRTFLLFNIEHQDDPFIEGGHVYQKCGQVEIVAGTQGKPVEFIDCVDEEIDWVLDDDLKDPDHKVSESGILWLYGMSTILPEL